MQVRSRVLMMAVVGLALAGCDSGEIPTPTERLQQGDAQALQAEEGSVELTGEGLVVGEQSYIFSSDRSAVEEAVAEALGEPEGRESNDECGAGPMEFTFYPGGLTLNFQNEVLVGWFFDEQNEWVATSGNVTIGTPRAELEGDGGFALIEDSTLGEEFYLGDSIGGFLEDETVSGLYAGTTCFFR